MLLQPVSALGAVRTFYGDVPRTYSGSHGDIGSQFSTLLL